jgi:hypothetical protein
MRLGQEQFTMAHRQPAIRHGPEHGTATGKLARQPGGSRHDPFGQNRVPGRDLNE